MTPEQEQGQGIMEYIPIFHVLKLFQVVCFNDTSMAFKCPVLAPDTASGNGFCIILVPVPVSVPDINDREPISGEFTGAESPWNPRGAVRIPRGTHGVRSCVSCLVTCRCAGSTIILDHGGALATTGIVRVKFELCRTGAPQNYR